MATTSTWTIAWRNLGRNRKRSLLAGGAIALGQFTFLATAAVMHGYAEQYFDSITGPLIGHVQIHAPQWRQDRAVDRTIDEVESVLEAIRADPAVERAAARLYAPVLAALAEEGFMAVVVGADPESEAVANGLLQRQELAAHLGDGRVLVGRGFSRRHGIEAGAELAVIGQDIDGSIASELYEVAAVIDSPVDLVNSMGIVASLADVRTLLRMGSEAHEIVVHLTEADRVGETATRLAALPPLAAAEVRPWHEVVPQMAGIIELMNTYTLVILLIVFLASAAGIANTLLMSTFERRRELGMLLALGSSPGRLFRLVAAEAVLLGLLGVAAGTALGGLFVGLTAGPGFDFVVLGGQESFQVGYQGLQVSSRVFPELYAQDIVAGVAAVLVTAFAACVWPMLHIARLEPMEAMRA